MTESRNPLLIALIALQIATLCCVTLLFFNSSTQRNPLDATVGIDNGNNLPAGNVFAPANGLEAELRAMRAEIAALRVATGAPAPVTFDATMPPSEQELQTQTQALNSSSLIIQGAVSAGVWTRADTKALLPHIGKVSQQQRRALVEELASAVNRQELKLENLPPL
jgi:hypothetical protein